MATIIGILVGVAALLGFLYKGGTVLWRFAGGATKFVEAVRENTDANAEVAEELRTFRGDVTQTLADHSERIARLEGR